MVWLVLAVAFEIVFVAAAVRLDPIDRHAPR
jgi:hypothetical protein